MKTLIRETEALKKALRKLGVHLAAALLLGALLPWMSPLPALPAKAADGCAQRFYEIGKKMHTKVEENRWDAGGYRYIETTFHTSWSAETTCTYPEGNRMELRRNGETVKICSGTCKMTMKSEGYETSWTLHLNGQSHPVEGPIHLPANEKEVKTEVFPLSPTTTVPSNPTTTQPKTTPTTKPKTTPTTTPAKTPTTTQPGGGVENPETTVPAPDEKEVSDGGRDELTGGGVGLGELKCDGTLPTFLEVNVCQATWNPRDLPPASQRGAGDE